jgi:catechol 2,3-dioxygenase-like lactoylglutathione lyase family enzyme
MLRVYADEFRGREESLLTDRHPRRGARMELKSLGAITLFAEDLAATSAFYRDALGLQSIYEDANSTVFDFGNTVVNVLDASEAPELVEPAVVAPPDAGARQLLSIWVDDVDAVCAELTRRGVELVNGPVDRPWGKRTASFADPAGNLWEVAQDI